MKGKVLFLGCLAGNVLACCKEDKCNVASKENVSKFKKRLSECFGIEDDNIISVKPSDERKMGDQLDSLFTQEEINQSVRLFEHKIGGKYLYCLTKVPGTPNKAKCEQVAVFSPMEVNLDEVFLVLSKGKKGKTWCFRLI